MITITRRLEIDYGHRLMNHEGKCRNAHGHRGVFDVECAAPELDKLGRVIDFSVLKGVLGGWLDDNWDHGFIYEQGDPIGDFLIKTNQKSFMLKTGWAPTSEHLAQFFLGKARDLMLDFGIEVVSVKMWETPNCYALAR